jgi:hypothetical protein
MRLLTVVPVGPDPVKPKALPALFAVLAMSR